MKILDLCLEVVCVCVLVPIGIFICVIGLISCSMATILGIGALFMPVGIFLIGEHCYVVKRCKKGKNKSER